MEEFYREIIYGAVKNSPNRKALNKTVPFGDRFKFGVNVKN